MSVPGIVQEALNDEDVAARVPIGGEDVLFVTPTRTLLYRAEGLLSDESVAEYPHDAEQVTVKEGRRKTRIHLEYAIEGEEEFTIPAKHTQQVLHPILAGVISASGVTDAGETVIQTYRFSEMTLIVTDRRIVKHIGQAVWDEDYEEYRYEDVTGLDFEEGSVATQVVLTVGGRTERIKAPNDRASEVRRRVTDALCDYYDVRNEEELRAAIAPDEDEQEVDADATAFGEGVDPLGVESTADETADADTETTSDAVEGTPTQDSGDGAAATAAEATSTTESRSTSSRNRSRESQPAADDRETARSADPNQRSATRTDTRDAANAGDSARERGDTSTDDLAAAGFETAQTAESTDAAPVDTAELEREIADLREVVERQNDLLEQQQATIKQLIEELSRGR